MAFRLYDWTWETTATTGTGPYSLAGAVAPWRPFSAQYSDGDTTYISVFDGVNFEEGTYTYNAGGNSWARTSVQRSSNGGAAVNWGAGVKQIIAAQIGISLESFLTPGSRGYPQRTADNTWTYSTANDIVASGLSLVNVKQYGATGDGMTDDTVAINNAIAAAANGNLYIPAGTYIVSDISDPHHGLITTSPVSIVAEPDAIIRLKSGTYNSFAMVLIQSSDVTIEGGWWDFGSGNSSAGSNCSTIEATSNGGSYPDRLLLDRIYATGSNYEVLYLRDGNDMVVRDSRIVGYGGTVTGIGVWCSGRDMYRPVVEGCVVDMSARTSNGDGINYVNNSSGVYTCYQGRISGNRVIELVNSNTITSLAIEVWADTLGHHQHHVVADNNINGGTFGISVNSSTTAAITGNAVNAVKSYGIEMASTVDSTCTGNTVDGGAILTTGITCDGGNSTGNSITGNTIRNMSASAGSNQYAIGVDSAYTVISGNVIDNGSSQAGGIFINTADHQVITGNNINSGTNSNNAGIYVVEASFVTITGNNVNAPSATNAIQTVASTGTTRNHILCFNNNALGAVNPLNITGTYYGTDFSWGLSTESNPACSIQTNSDRITLVANGLNGGGTTNHVAEFIGKTSATNYFLLYNNQTGSGPNLVAKGSDTNVDLVYITQAAGAHRFYTNVAATVEQVRILHSASATNYLTLTGSNGGAPTISASAGNVGFGTGITFNGTGVNIDGNYGFRLSGSSSPFVGYNNGSAQNALIGVGSGATPNVTIYSSGGAGNLILTSTNLLGIGVTPTNPLDVANASGAIQFSVLNTASATRSITVTGSNGGNPTIGTSAGSLAIGASATVAGTFTVNGQAAGATFNINGDTTGHGASVFFQGGGTQIAQFYANSGSAAFNFGAGAGGGIPFTFSSNSGNMPLRVNAVTGSSALLDLQVNSATLLEVGANAGGGAISLPTAAMTFSINTAGGTQLAVLDTSSVTRHITITGSNGGNPTIGASGGSVNINATVQMSTYGAGAATFDASGNITSVSDERLKAISGPYTPGLSSIEKITPIIYKWNDKSGMETEHDYAGFSAQNVRDALGELAVGRNAAGMLSLQDRAVLAAAINALKELSTRVTQLEGRV